MIVYRFIKDLNILLPCRSGHLKYIYFLNFSKFLVFGENALRSLYFSMCFMYLSNKIKCNETVKLVIHDLYAQLNPIRSRGEGAQRPG